MGANSYQWTAPSGRIIIIDYSHIDNPNIK
jgi:hypothetical protein